MFYQNRSKLKNNAKVKLDYEKVYDIYESFRVSQEGQYCGLHQVDINCCLNVVFKSGPSKLFSDDDSLKKITEQERIQ